MAFSKSSLNSFSSSHHIEYSKPNSFPSSSSFLSRIYISFHLRLSRLRLQPWRMDVAPGIIHPKNIMFKYQLRCFQFLSYLDKANRLLSSFLRNSCSMSLHNKLDSLKRSCRSLRGRPRYGASSEERCFSVHQSQN